MVSPNLIYFWKYLKQNWQRVSLIAGALLVCISIVIVLVLILMHRTGVSRTPVQNVNGAPALPIARTYDDLYAVVIDNHTDARPASGLTESIMVYEAPVEGGITRFLAVFERGKTIAEIGPVRSARPYFLDWMSELGPALFLHVGGSPESLATLVITPSFMVVDADGMGNAGVSFWRDDTRAMPHNAYTSSKEVEKLFFKHNSPIRTVTTYLMAHEPAVDARGEGKGVVIPFFTPTYAPEWRYDREHNTYVRYAKDKIEKTRDGQQIEAKNVVVLYTDVSTIDDIGRKKIRTSGEGTGLLLNNGAVTEITWRNDTGGTPVVFYDKNGSELALTSGNVWIEVVPKTITVEVR